MINHIAYDELLARYILSSKWFHKGDQTVKQDAFVPNYSSELSVTRHAGFSENDLWQIGKMIAGKITRTLHGRADVKTAHVLAQHLSVVPKPEQGNPNHANIVSWPSNKDARKMCALEIARVARFIANPEVGAQNP